ncbi:MAG: YqjF family protein [Saprospiraceae bacterium]
MTFLTAEWRKLLMANYIVPPEILRPFVPWGTELDLWQGKCYISLVGFMFMNTRVLGIAIPFHRDFEEVNLRFYVRRKVGNEWQRGVVFIKEIVPKPAIALVANLVYAENYVTHRMRHSWNIINGNRLVLYEWKPYFSGDWYKMSAVTESEATPISTGSEAEFITEHYWGYASFGTGSTNEYQVQHPRWDVYKVHSHELSGNFAGLYGKAFGEILNRPPDSVFVAEGSEISVFGKLRIK